MFNKTKRLLAKNAAPKVESVKLNLCLELTGFSFSLSSQSGLQKYTQLLLNKQPLPAIQVQR
jgi:hypothetical protein